MQLITPEWAAAYTQAWNSDEKLMRKLRHFSSVFKYSISDREDLEPVVIEVENGVCTSYGTTEQYDNIEYEVWADSASWQKIFNNHDNIKKVLNSDGFEFKGPKLKALSNKRGLERSVEIMLNIDNVTV